MNARRTLLGFCVVLLFAGGPASGQMDNDGGDPHAIYLQKMCTFFGEDGSLLARVVVQSIRPNPDSGTIARCNKAAAFLAGKLKALHVPAEFQDSHKELVDTLEYISGWTASTVVAPVGQLVPHPEEGPLILAVDAQTYIAHSSQDALKHYHDAVVAYTGGKCAPLDRDPFDACKNPTANIVSIDSTTNPVIDLPEASDDPSRQFGLGDAVHIPSERTAPGLDLGGLLTNLGYIRRQ